MRVRFCGVRGSTPAPGRLYDRTGGHTSCVLIWPTDGARASLVLDAGTGIREVTALLGGAPFRGTILLTHLHWDHLQGLPFFGAADRDDADVRLLLPEQGEPAASLLERAMSPPHFPIGTTGLHGRWTFGAIDEGTHEIEGCLVTAREIRHKGGRTFGYRIEGRDAVIAYLPDHQPPEPGRARDAALELARDVDLLIHDAQFVAGEERLADAYGHATIEGAVAFAAEAGVEELALFHHSPTRTDSAIDGIAGDWERSTGRLRVSIAIEGDGRDIARTDPTTHAVEIGGGRSAHPVEGRSVARGVFLDTERLVLRRFTLDDLDLLVELDADAEVMRFINGGEPVDRFEVATMLSWWIEYDERLDGLGFWAATEKATDAFIGWFHLRPGDDDGPFDAELGYRLRRSVWGRGLATEGARALIDKGFSELGLERVRAETMALNAASRRVMEKSGLRYIRTFRAEWPVRIAGDEHGDVEYAITRAEWEVDRRPC